jgi:lipopolysaccharide/colanic/teichoic acid biosynthesis glycosyltransferase
MRLSSNDVQTSRWLQWLEGWISLRSFSLYHAYPWLITKRLLDLHLCLLILPVALIVMIIIAVAIKLDSPGPVFFIHERVGFKGRRFRLYKFRSLRHDYNPVNGREFMMAFVRGHVNQSEKHSSSTLYKPIDRAHITRVGRLLRRTSLDELPQIFNVLRGDMSVVGPRPNVPYEVEAYEEWHKERLLTLPGITGLAQVRGRSGIAFDQIVMYDIQYIRTRSLKLDLLILWWTVASVLGGQGAG